MSRNESNEVMPGCLCSRIKPEETICVLFCWQICQNVNGAMPHGKFPATAILNLIRLLLNNPPAQRLPGTERIRQPLYRGLFS